MGVQSFDVPDADDFVVSPGAGGPDWHLESVVYQVFPDRFASSGSGVDAARLGDPARLGRAPDRTRARDAVRVVRRRPARDRGAARPPRRARRERPLPHPGLPGAEHASLRRDHLRPVDPLLGGDDALASLVARRACARDPRARRPDDEPRGRRATSGSSPRRTDGSPSAGSSTSTTPTSTATRAGSASRPSRSSTTRSPELRERMYAGSSSVVRRWLEPPYDLDGWRIDVANMTGRSATSTSSPRSLAAFDAAAVASAARRARRGGARPRRRADLAPGGWHGDDELRGLHAPGLGVAARGRPPGRSARRASSGSRSACRSSPGESIVAHDARVPRRHPLVGVAPLVGDARQPRHRRASATIAGSRERQLVGVGLQMTTPGVPMVFAGDEIGLEGEWGEDARRTMPWSRPETWDTTLLDGYRELIALRRSSRALARGGSATRTSRGRDRVPARGDRRAVLCLAARGAHDPVRLPLARSAARARDAGGRGRLDRRRRRRPPGRRAGVPRLESRVTTEEARVAEVQLKDVDKIYEGDVHAVQDLSLDVADGEFLVLVGPSGCGKTTALRMVAGLEDITDGTITIGDRVVNELSPKDRDIAMVFQNYALYPHMSVADNIAFGLRLRKMPKHDDRRARRVGGEAARPRAVPRRASRGSSPAASASVSRWAARSCASRRCSSWTSRSRTSTRSCASRCAPRSRSSSTSSATTTIYVTHDQVEAMTMGDRVAVMSMGVLQQVDTPQQLYDAPREPLRRGLHRHAADEPLRGGRSDATTATVVASRSARRRSRSSRRASRATAASASCDGRNVVVGVRAEDLHPAVDAAGSPDARRARRARRGARLRRHGALPHRRRRVRSIEARGAGACGRRRRRRRRARVALSPRSPTSSRTSRRGSICGSATRVPVASTPPALHFFDEETGARFA